MIPKKEVVSKPNLDNKNKPSQIIITAKVSSIVLAARLRLAAIIKLINPNIPIEEKIVVAIRIAIQFGFSEPENVRNGPSKPNSNKHPLPIPTNIFAIFFI